jgi:Lrp/AsnC family transcriptional regulator for asnA, asnC and gidA
LIWYFPSIGPKGEIDIKENAKDMDEIDRTILKHLRDNSRMSLQEMSRLTGISDSTLQFRLKRLRAKEIIEKFTIMASPAATGYAVTAMVLVQTDTERHDEAKMALAKIPEITEVYGILGEHDLLVKVWCKSLEELNRMINGEIRSVEGVKELLEMLVMERVKEETPPV